MAASQKAYDWSSGRKSIEVMEFPGKKENTLDLFLF
jgi:hypothetical protein